VFVEWGASVQLETGGYLPLQPVPEWREAVAEIVLVVDEVEKEQPVQEREKGRVRRWMEEARDARQHSN